MAPDHLALKAQSTSVSTATATLTVSRPIRLIIARNLNAIRKERKLTQRQLADKVELLGVKIDHSRIARVEHGSASLDLPEAVAVSIALGISLEALITPDEANEKVRMTPTIDVDREQVHTWLVGQEDIDRLIDDLRHRVHELAALRPGYERVSRWEEMIARSPAAINTPPNYRHRGQQEDHARIRAFLRLEQEVEHLRDAALVRLENPLLPPDLLERLRAAVNAVPPPVGDTSRRATP